jgi:hypothetical protein
MGRTHSLILLIELSWPSQRQARGHRLCENLTHGPPLVLAAYCPPKLSSTYTDHEVNKLYSHFMAKIRVRVHDPAVAEQLIPPSQPNRL